MPEQAFTGTLKPGVKLGKYEVRQQLGMGGMAAVYRAYDSSLDRTVAIKQIAPHLAQDERFLTRFRTEAQTLAKISATQPNIVNVIELIEQDGQLFLVMECVEGTTLRAMMDRGPIPLQTGLGVLLSTALGLKAMHAQGIVHRDLSPANIMMARDGALKITDFGLIGHSGGKTSLPMGTTKYMAPEMFTGAPVDARADLYSLGMIAYEMFVGPDKFADAFKDVLRDERSQQVRWMHWHSNPTLKAPALRDLQPGIPPLVAKIVERMLEKDPSKRFASAEQIIKWLRRIFVMHVQGKSISQTDSESLEKEMEAEAAGGTALAARPASAAAAAAGMPAVTTGEKTAPLPVPKWTWKRALFWAAVVLAPFILAGAGLYIWSENERGKLTRLAQDAQADGDEQFKNKEYANADQTFTKMANDFRKLPEYALYAKQHAMMARAEEALVKKDWERADSNATVAEQKFGAPPLWVNNFRERFQKYQYIDQVMRTAEAAQNAGDFQKAIDFLNDLQAKYPDLKLDEVIAALREKLELREYRRQIDDGKQLFGKGNLSGARDAYFAAKKIRETPEVNELIQGVENDIRYAQWYAVGEKAASEGKWADAYKGYDEAFRIKPSEALRQKRDCAKAEELAAQAEILDQNNEQKAAREIWSKVIQLNPRHAKAVKALGLASRLDQLENYTTAAKNAMTAKQYDQAITSATQALGVIDPAKEAAQKTALDNLIAEATYQKNIEGATQALDRNDFTTAADLAGAAKAVRDNDEVKALLQRVETRKQYKYHLDVGKELLKQVQLVPALASFERAQKIEPTQEVSELIRETNYLRYFIKAKYLRDTGKLVEGLSIIKIARGYKDSIEAQAIQQQIEGMMKAPKKATEQ